MNQSMKKKSPLYRRRKGERGFTLMELGIVIAVIAVLATVVLLGRGFIQASRVSKASEAVSTVKKAASTYAGLSGGTFTNVGAGDKLAALQGRQLVPGTGGAWTVIDGFSVSGVRVNTNGSVNSVLIQMTVPAGGPAADIFNGAKNDPQLVTTARTIDTVPCTTSATETATSVALCFDL